MALHRVITRPEYFAEIEEHLLADGQQVLFFHHRFTIFSPAALKQALKDWRIFRQVVTAPLYAYAGEDNGDKWRHFVSLFGFQPTGRFISLNNGERRELYLSTVNARKHQFQPNPAAEPAEQPVGTSSSFA